MVCPSTGTPKAFWIFVVFSLSVLLGDTGSREEDFLAPIFLLLFVCFFTLLLGLVKLVRPRSHLHLTRAVFSPGSVSLGQTPKLQGLSSLLPSFFAFFEPTLSSLIFQPTKPHISLVLHKTDQMNSFPLCLTKRLMIQEFKKWGLPLIPPQWMHPWLEKSWGPFRHCAREAHSLGIHNKSSANYNYPRGWKVL